MIIAPTNARSILVVEDEALTAKDLQRSLERLGYSALHTAASASEAIDLALQQKPDLVLMDIHLDGPSDGIEAANVITTRLKIPIVFLTAFADKETVQRAKQVTPYGYLLKPVRAEDLRVTVELALHKHAAEMELRARERWYSQTLHSIADAVICVDPGAIVTFMNSAAEFMTGVRANEAVGRHVRDVLRLTAMGHGEATTLGDLLPESPLEQVLREGHTVELPEAGLRNCANQEELVISDSASLVLSDGERLGAVMVFHNITERKQLQDRLLMAERMASLGLVAAGVAHEITNPLMAVMGGTDLLANHLSEHASTAEPHFTDDPSSITELVEDMRSASERIRSVVHDLTFFSRTEQSKLEPVALQEVMESTLRMARFTVQTHARVETHYAPAPKALANESRIGQVFLNLLVNAAQAMPTGSPERNRIRVEIASDGDGFVVVEIMDNGTGMSEATRKRLFTPFFTTKPSGQGTGLGLSICHRIVTSYGGDIDIDSEPGRGTTVRVKLPAAQTDGTRWSGSKSATPPRRARIMLVDDDPAFTKLVSRILANDHEVFVFASARDAVHRLALGESYDFIFWELMLPNMNGMEIFERLLTSYPEQAASLVLLTGGALTPRVQSFLKRTHVSTLEKPVDPEALGKLLAARLRGSQAPPSAGEHV